jgi:hypothetical protein
MPNIKVLIYNTVKEALPQGTVGGGKTHAMLAVYHLVKANDLALLDGLSALAEKADVRAWQKQKPAGQEWP